MSPWGIKRNPPDGTLGDYFFNQGKMGKFLKICTENYNTEIFKYQN